MRAFSREREGYPRMRAFSREREGYPRMEKENSHMRPPLPVSAAAAATAASNVRPPRADDVFYPSSDGKPMAENMWQAEAILNARSDLGSARPQALVAADILMYPEEGNNRNSIAPDVLVAFGIGTHKRSSYFVWEEGKPPDWILEVASPGTQAEDRGHKRRRYAEIGVPEYWMFDPKGGVYPRGTPRLQGLKLVDGEYHPLEPKVVDGERVIHSEVLGLDVRVDGELLRFRDPATGKDVRHRDEIEADEELAQAAAERAQAVAERAEAAIERAQAETRQEAAQRKSAEARAEREAASRAKAEARVAELEAALQRSQAGDP